MATIGVFPGDKIRLFCDQHGLTQQERDYLLGVLGEAVVVEREACARVAEAEVREWEDGTDHKDAVSTACEMIAHRIRDRERGQP